MKKFVLSLFSLLLVFSVSLVLPPNSVKADTTVKHATNVKPELMYSLQKTKYDNGREKYPGYAEAQSITYTLAPGMQAYGEKPILTRVKGYFVIKGDWGVYGKYEVRAGEKDIEVSPKIDRDKIFFDLSNVDYFDHFDDITLDGYYKHWTDRDKVTGFDLVITDVWYQNPEITEIALNVNDRKEVDFKITYDVPFLRKWEWNSYSNNGGYMVTLYNETTGSRYVFNDNSYNGPSLKIHYQDKSRIHATISGLDLGKYYNFKVEVRSYVWSPPDAHHSSSYYGARDKIVLQKDILIPTPLDQASEDARKAREAAERAEKEVGTIKDKINDTDKKVDDLGKDVNNKFGDVNIRIDGVQSNLADDIAALDTKLHLIRSIESLNKYKSGEVGKLQLAVEFEQGTSIVVSPALNVKSINKDSEGSYTITLKPNSPDAIKRGEPKYEVPPYIDIIGTKNVIGGTAEKPTTRVITNSKRIYAKDFYYEVIDLK